MKLQGRVDFTEKRASSPTCRMCSRAALPGTNATASPHPGRQSLWGRREAGKGKGGELASRGQVTWCPILAVATTRWQPQMLLCKWGLVHMKYDRGSSQ